MTTPRRSLLVLSALLASMAATGAAAAAQSSPAAPANADDRRWSAAGTLLESCTCAVPCTCNFGEGPSPHPYCYAVFAYRLEKASWAGTDLSGLVVGGADGPKGRIGFLDERAPAAQRPALERLARALFAQGGPSSGPRRFVPVRITYSVRGNALRLDFAGYGGFTGQVIVGRDGKTPIIVENNLVWPLPRATKAKALPLSFDDPTIGAFHGDGTNANVGAFSLSGSAADSEQAK